LIVGVTAATDALGGAVGAGTTLGAALTGNATVSTGIATDAGADGADVAMIGPEDVGLRYRT